MITWKLKPFHQLEVKELYQILKLRVDVFVVEQTCPYPDLDDKDQIPGVHHVFALNENSDVLACARLLPEGISYNNISIGRVVVAESERRSGLGHELMKQALHGCEKLWGKGTIDISAQLHLTGYYQKHGFEPLGDHYLEDGIPHIKMRKESSQ